MTTTNRCAMATLRPPHKPTLTRVRWIAGDAAGVKPFAWSESVRITRVDRTPRPIVSRCPACLAALEARP
jgi:hypothetical protein